MTYSATKTSLVKAFAAVSLAVAATGCSTIPPCDQACNLEQSARAMASSSDVGVRAMGVQTLETLHPEIKKSGNQMRDIAVSKNVECTVSGVEIIDGKKVMKLTGCAAPAPANP